MKEIKAIIQPFMVEHVLEALRMVDGLPGLIISQVSLSGRALDVGEENDSHRKGHAIAAMTKLEIVVREEQVDSVVNAIAKSARTGQIGDGKIFVYDVADAIRIRTGTQGTSAI